MNRRQFFERLGLGLVSAGLAGGTSPEDMDLIAHSLTRGTLDVDVAVIGGGGGGCAAALAIARNGYRVVMTEETDWIGGQLSQQGVPPDEHPWIEQFGATASYREYRNRVREAYRSSYPLRGGGYRDRQLNPGNCSVSRICHEPRVSVGVLRSMLRPHVSSGRLTVLREHVPVSASVTGDEVDAVRVRNKRTRDEVDLTAAFFLDATELGDLLPMTGTEYVVGAESVDETGEPHALPEARPDNHQAVTWCFAMDYVEGEDHTIDRPEMYDFWRDFEPDLEPPWPGRQLDFTYSHPPTLEPTTADFDPRRGGDNPGFWRYRRLIDPKNFEAGAYRGGICLVNWPQNDYWRGNMMEVNEEERVRHEHEAMQLSYSLLYWLQTEAPRSDGGQGWPGLRLRGDVMGTDHGLAKRPYVRESRRIEAEFTVTERHVGTEARMEITGRDRGEVTAAPFEDSVGIGSYRIDLHPSTRGRNYVDFSSLPFRIPLGSLLPVRMENLLPACKNLGVTHITNGCYRLHPVEWNIGESAGLLSAFALEHEHAPRAVRNDETVRSDFQRFLQSEGIELEWPDP